MADINGREFSMPELRRIFAVLDARGTRQDVRRVVRELQGSGVSNATVAALRQTHLRLRRSQGYAIAPGAQRSLRATPDSPLPRLRDLGTRITRGTTVARLSPSRVPAPPPQLNLRQAIRFDSFDDSGRLIGSRIELFDVGPDHPSVADQVREARRRGGGSPRPGEVRIGGRGYEVLGTFSADGEPL